MQPGRARTSGLGVPLLPLVRWVSWVAPVRPTHGVLVLSCPSAALRVCSVLGRLAPVHRCARAVCCVASAVSSATWLLFTGVLARCVVLRVRCPVPLGSRSPVCALCAVRVCHGSLCPSFSPPNFRFFLLEKKKKEKKNRGARTLQAQARAAGAAVQQCCVLWRVLSVLWRRSRPVVRLARPDVHGHGPGWVWLGVCLLLELAGLAAVWAVGVGCGYAFPPAGLVRGQRLAVLGCGSGLICVWVLARLGGCDGSGPGFRAFGRSGARCRVRWRPSASGSFGDFWAGPGVARRVGCLLGNGVRWRRRWPGGQARCVVWCAGLLGCCGCRRCRCADACGVVRGCVCAGLSFG